MNRITIFASLVFLAFACAPKTETVRKDSSEVYNLSQGKAVPLAAKQTTLPMYVFGEGPGAAGNYVASGYIGDSASLKLTSRNFSGPVRGDNPGQHCLKVTYRPKGQLGWAGVYWLTPANNWGKIKGAGYDVSGSPTLVFWARGEKGGERLAEVRMGGIVGPYPDTDSASLDNIKLTTEWQRYELDLSGKDLRHIVGGFLFTVRRPDNPHGAVFYIDEIYFAGSGNLDEAAAEKTLAENPSR
jgi:hypothetical protein